MKEKILRTKTILPLFHGQSFQETQQCALAYSPPEIKKFQVQHADGSQLAKDEAVTVVNLFPESVFSRINVFLNGLPVR